MPDAQIDSLDFAVRVYPEAHRSKQQSRSIAVRKWRRPDGMLVFDTETRIDAAQTLLFGCFQYIADGKLLREALFYADDLAIRDVRLLHKYVDQRQRNSRLALITRKGFLEEIHRIAVKGKQLLVGFNLPFDLSRLAFDQAAAREFYSGGFSLGLWSYTAGNQEKRNPYRPRVAVKHVDSKRALIGFTGTRRDPSGRTTKPFFRGHFLDLRTLAFALTDRGHSLESACKAFNVRQGKSKVSKHGEISNTYVDYNRQDVTATAELANKLLEEFDRHDISLQDTKAFSPASVGKAYLRKMGITTILQRHTTFQPYLGYAQTAFFGGRTSAHIRKVPVPVVYTDFLSMYPTVNSLLKLWDFVIAQHIRVVDHCKDEVIAFLNGFTHEDLFKPETWNRLRGFVRIMPNGDILPTRGKYNSETNDWQVAISHLYAKRNDDALWFCPASVGNGESVRPLR
jgi:hypothetical protein